MSEKKILPKETISEEKLSNVSGGETPIEKVSICPVCNMPFPYSSYEYFNHLELHYGKNLISFPSPFRIMTQSHINRAKTVLPIHIVGLNRINKAVYNTMLNSPLAKPIPLYYT